MSLRRLLLPILSLLFGVFTPGYAGAAAVGRFKIKTVPGAAASAGAVHLPTNALILPKLSLTISPLAGSRLRLPTLKALESVETAVMTPEVKPSALQALKAVDKGVEQARDSGAGEASPLDASFDGVEKEGTPVEDLFPLITGPGAEAQGRDVSPALNEDIRWALPAISRGVQARSFQGEPMTLDSPCCGIAAPSLGLLLRRRGHPVHAVEAEFHVYLVHERGGGALIIDPSVRQFFGGKTAPRNIPKVFVGTMGELQELFRRNREYLSTKYDVSRIYKEKGKVNDGLIAEVSERLARIETLERRPEILDPIETAELDAYRPLRALLKDSGSAGD